MDSKPRNPDSGEHRSQPSKTPHRSQAPRCVEIPVSVVLLIPVPNSIPGDVDNMKEDAVELVRHGRLSLDGIDIHHRLAK